MAITNFVEVTRAGLVLTGKELNALAALLSTATGTAMKGVAELGRVKAQLDQIGATGKDYEAVVRDGKVYVDRV
jgi:hypothetical protein